MNSTADEQKRIQYLQNEYRRQERIMEEARRSHSAEIKQRGGGPGFIPDYDAMPDNPVEDSCMERMGEIREELFKLGAPL